MSRDRIHSITDLLLGATHADGVHKGEEEAVLRKLLKQWLKVDELPDEVEDRIAGFDAKAFDVKRAAADFTSDDKAEKRKLIELVAAVRDADGEVDLDEDAYLRGLARALGMKDEEYADLTLDIDIDVSDLAGNLAALRPSKPPPIPKR